jgi:hypothetical protein
VRRRERLVICLGANALVALALAAGASGATTRYASPGGGATGAEPCPLSDPCTLAYAIQGHTPGQVVNGDTVVVLSGLGAYNPGTSLLLSANVDLGGEPGKPLPVIHGAGTVGLTRSGPATIHDLRIEQAAGTAGLSLDGAPAGLVAERVLVSYAGSSGIGACQFTETIVMKDSVCLATGTGGSGVINGGGVVNVTLRNVTAIGTGTGARGIRMDSNSNDTLVGTNVIAFGTLSDVLSSTTGGTTKVTLDHSNYDSAPTIAVTGTATATPPGTNGNQTAPPLFANFAGGDFREVGGSPTIDAGLDDPANGSFDLDHAARIQATCLGGTAKPDIGAYEIAPPVASPACSLFTIGTLKRNKKKGTATLTVDVPGGGVLTATGKSLKKASANATALGSFKLKLKASGKAKRKLDDQGKAKLKLTVRWAPTGNTAATQKHPVKLKKK